jgi:hypothetical protein
VRCGAIQDGLAVLSVSGGRHYTVNIPNRDCWTGCDTFVPLVNGGFGKGRTQQKWSSALFVKEVGPPGAGTGMALRGFVHADTGSQDEGFAESIIEPGLENFIDDDVNYSAFGLGMGIGVHNVPVLNDVTQISRERNKQPEAVLLHTCCIGVSNFGPHADKLLVIHSILGLVFDRALLTIIPNEVDDFSIWRNIPVSNVINPHSVRMVFVQLSILSGNPLFLVWSDQARSMCVFFAVGHFTLAAVMRSMVSEISHPCQI